MQPNNSPTDAYAHKRWTRDFYITLFGTRWGVRIGNAQFSLWRGYVALVEYFPRRTGYWVQYESGKRERFGLLLPFGWSVRCTESV